VAALANSVCLTALTTSKGILHKPQKKKKMSREGISGEHTRSTRGRKGTLWAEKETKGCKYCGNKKSLQTQLQAKCSRCRKKWSIK